MSDGKVAIGILVVLFGIVGAVIALSMISRGAMIPPPPIPPPFPKKYKVKLLFRPDRAVGKDPNSGYEDKLVAEWEIISGVREYSRGTLKIEDFRANKAVEQEVELAEGTYTVIVYYPNKAEYKQRTEVKIEVKGDMTKEIVFGVNEPSGMSAITLEAIDYGGELYNRGLYTSGGTEYLGIVNGNHIAFILPQGTDIDYIKLMYPEGSAFVSKVVTNVRLTQDFSVRVYKEKERSDTEFVLEVLTFDKYTPYKDCKIVVYRGGNPIIEKDAEDLPEGNRGIREVVSKSGIQTLTVYMKSKDGAQTYGQVEVTLPGIAYKAITVILDKTYKWR